MKLKRVTLAILPKTNITYDDVLSLCSAQGHIFQFIDFWLNRQPEKALNNLRDLLVQQNAMPILATLQTMLSKWIKLKALYETYNAQSTTSSASEIAKLIANDLKAMPFVVEKDLRRLQKYRRLSISRQALTIDSLRIRHQSWTNT